MCITQRQVKGGSGGRLSVRVERREVAGEMMERTNSTKPRKIMVVAEPGRETFGALEWVLSHAIVEQDELILLHIENAASWRNTITTFLRRPSLSSSSFGNAYLNAIAAANESNRGGGAGPGAGGGETDFLEEMKNICEAVQPKVKIQTERVWMEGKDKAFTILMQSRVLSIDLLVIGQKRSLANAILGCKLVGGSTKAGNKTMDTAEYLIEHSRCTCVGVQKKGQNGYLLNSKTHKNFWLLA